jgi:hypothetical protein
MLKYITDMMADTCGSPSTKRWIAMIAMLLICTAFISNLFWDYTIEEFIFDGAMYIVIGALGITGIEKFSPKKPTKNNTEEQ